MKTINITCGIYETEYSLTAHRDGSITVKAPYIKWINNNGSLDFSNYHFSAGSLAEKIKQAFANNTLFLSGYEAEFCVTLQDAIDGYLN